jgi:hypothetical protein
MGKQVKLPEIVDPATQAIARSEKGRWQKGQSGNPKGTAVKGESLTNVLREYGQLMDIRRKADGTGYEIAPDGKGTIKRVEALANVCYLKALSGDAVFAKLIYDRVDGSPKQTAEITDGKGNSIKITFDDDYGGL